MSSIEVMIIEDDIRASYALETTINRQDGFKVVAVAETCADALFQYGIFRPQLVFVDITLPDGRGIEVIKELRSRNEKCDFVMTTALRNTAIIEEAIQLGVRDYLVKPLRMSRVVQTLNDFRLYKEQINQTQKIDQTGIDQLFNRPVGQNTRTTPKGINQQTLEKFKQLIFNEDLDSFSAEEIGVKLKISRITARRYLEFLETEGLIYLELNYNTGGRPKRIYRVQKREK